MTFKSNGRYKPARKEEVASLKSKTFTCKHCNATTVIENVQFAEEQKCSVCGNTMIEFGQEGVEVAKLTGRIN